MDNKDRKRNISVAVDGPSGSGKSTLSRAAAKELSLVYVDTGAIYRTTALHILRRGADPGDAAAVAALLPEVGITLSYDAAGVQRMCLNGEDVTELIRTQEVSMAASTVSAYPAVRAFLLEMQRELARRHSVIMDGRDIGTVVLPEADVKIFLTAGSEIRARRRWLELQERGTPRDWEQLLRETRERDEKDANRAESPLRPAADSVLLDTSELDFAQSLGRIIEIIRERTGS
ncbi:MAG: (d)CMP kinase [Oscillospiraceae bacterium]|nr:(d)CMP kinase [Oscillospiraceae bacterium]MDE6931308.1 (d)CMP kinase [Oscillospiraceae bacterium]